MGINSERIWSWQNVSLICSFQEYPFLFLIPNTQQSSIQIIFCYSAKECHERWIRYLKPGVRKGQWQDHEDAIVVEAVTTSKEQPFTRWSDLAQRLPGRVGKQIRDRWVNHLNPNINHMPFTRDDDLLLWEGHKKLGKRWVEISSKYFNSSRSENHIKNRWYSASFKKFVANEFGPNAYSGGKKGKETKVSKKGPITKS